MATGASKAQVALAGLREFLIGRVLGPMAGLGATAVGVMASVTRMGRAFAQAGREGAIGIEKLTQSFSVLLKGAEAAKKRVAELVQFAKNTPFSMEGVVQANRTLEVLTKGALSTKRGMKLVGDAAAVAGADFEQVAMQVGRLYDGLQNGTPVGEAAFRLQELGLLSGAARQQIEQLQRTGADGSAVWAVAEADLKRYAGGMDSVSKSLGNLEMNLEDVQEMAKSTFAGGYMEGMKAGVEAQTKAIEGMLPTLKYMGEYLGGVSSQWDKFKAGVVSATVGSETFQKASIPLFQVVTSLGSALGITTGLIAAARVASIAAAAVQGNLAQALLGTTAAQNAQNASLVKASVAKSFTDKLAAVKAWHDKLLAAAGASGKFSVSTYAAGGAMKVFNLIMAGTIKTVQSLLASFMALGPIGWLVTALGAAGMGWMHYRKQLNDTAEAIKEFAAAQKQSTDALVREASASRTAADAAAVRAKTVRELVELLEQQKVAQEQVDKNNAKPKIKVVGSGKSDFRTTAGKLKEKEQNAANEELKRSIEVRRRLLAEQSAMAFVFSPEQVSSEAAVAEANSPALPADAAMLGAMLEEKRNEVVEKDRVGRELAAVDLAGEEARINGNDAGVREAARRRLEVQAESSSEAIRLQGQTEAFSKRNVLMGQVVGAKMDVESRSGPVSGDEEEMKKKVIDLAAAKMRLKKVEEDLAAAGGAVTEDDVAAYNAAMVALERLNAVTAEQIAQAKKRQEQADFSAGLDAEAARVELLDGEIERMKELQKIEEKRRAAMVADGGMSENEADMERQQAKTALEVLEKNRGRRAEDAGVGAKQALAGMQDGEFQREMALLDIENEKVRLALERKEISDEEASLQFTVLAAQRDRVKEMEARRVEDAGVTRDAGMAGVKDDSLDKELEMLDIEESRVNLAYERLEISKEERDMQLEVLDAQRDRAKELAARRMEAVKSEMKQTKLMMEARAARRGGDFAEGDRLEKEANAEGDAQFAKDETLRLRAAGFDEVTTAMLVQDQLAQRILEREERRAEAVAKVSRSLQVQRAALEGNLGVLSQMVAAERQRELIESGMTAGQAKQAQAAEQRMKDEQGAEDFKLNAMKQAAAALRARGDVKGAKRYEKRADAIEEKRRAAELVGDGMSEKEARRIAKGERSMNEAGRDGEGDGMKVGGRAVVSSLVRVGGGTGANVSGIIDLTRKGNDLLSKIEANTRAPAERGKFGGVSLVDF